MHVKSVKGRDFGFAVHLQESHRSAPIRRLLPLVIVTSPVSDLISPNGREVVSRLGKWYKRTNQVDMTDSKFWLTVPNSATTPATTIFTSELRNTLHSNTAQHSRPLRMNRANNTSDSFPPPACSNLIFYLASVANHYARQQEKASRSTESCTFSLQTYCSTWNHDGANHKVANIAWRRLHLSLP